MKNGQLENVERSRFCPFQLLREYTRVRPTFRDNNEQFFMYKDRMPETADSFRKILKKLLKLNRFDEHLYSSHGLHEGRVSNLLEMGISVETIQKNQPMEINLSICIPQVLKNVFSVSEPIVALKDCWIIGDLFVSQVFHTLPSRNVQNRLAHKKSLFLYDNFTVKCFSTNPLSKIKEAPARLVNSLAHAINENRYLPRLILILPDWDMIKHIGQVTYGIYEILERLIKWVINTMIRMVDTRKDDLSHHFSGAVAFSEPKFIWFKMINRINVQDRALAVRGKFNRALENILADKHQHYIMDVSGKINDTSYFSSQRKELNDDGLNKFWSEVDKMVEQFEFDKEPFKPKKSNFKHHHKRNFHSNSRKW